MLQIMSYYVINATTFICQINVLLLPFPYYWCWHIGFTFSTFSALVQLLSELMSPSFLFL